MNILYFITHITNSGGMEHIVIDKINYFVEHGYNISLAYFGNKADISFFPISEKVRCIPICALEDTVSFIHKTCMTITLVRRIYRIIEEQKPDIIVNANTVLISWILPCIRRDIPKIIELHFSYDGMLYMNHLFYAKNRLKGWINTFLRRFFYPKYTVCVLLTSEDKEKWDFRNAVVIPNYYDNCDELISNLDNKTILFVGRLQFEKNIPMLIGAFKIIHSKYPDWKLELWGSGPLENELHALIRKEQLLQSVHLRGRTNQMGHIYEKSSILVLPSFYEGFPLVLIEAMGAGIPCIGTDISGNKAIIKHNENGIIIKENSVEALAQAIDTLIRNPTLLHKMSKNAIQTALQYRKEIIIKRWIQLFISLTR